MFQIIFKDEKYCVCFVAEEGEGYTLSRHSFKDAAEESLGNFFEGMPILERERFSDLYLKRLRQISKVFSDIQKHERFTWCFVDFNLLSGTIDVNIQDRASLTAFFFRFIYSNENSVIFLEYGLSTESGPNLYRVEKDSFNIFEFLALKALDLQVGRLKMFSGGDSGSLHENLWFPELPKR